MDYCWSPEYMRMNNRVTSTAAKLFPYPQSRIYREHWEEICLKRWIDDPKETPHVQALRRSPNYLTAYAKRSPKIRY